MNSTSSMISFKFEDAPLRIIQDDGVDWFNANDVCEMLGYEKPRDAVATHVDPDDAVKRGVIDSMGRTQQSNFINESGLYSLIFGSKLETAKRFKKWVTSEVLPALRKTGTYSVSSKVAPNALVAHSITDVYSLARMVADDLVAQGVGRDVAEAIKYATVTTNTGVDLSDARKAIPGRTQALDVTWNNVTNLGKFLNGMSARKVNILLASKGLQTQNENGDWEPTEEGFKYAELKPYNKGGHVGMQVMWSKAVTDVIAN